MPKNEVSSSSQARILVVDDDEDSADLLADLLRSEGHDVYVANDPEAALQAVKAHQPRIAIVDIGLPTINGYELARRIRMLCPCKLIALSGFKAESAPSSEAVASFDLHFVKPLNIAALRTAIRDVQGADGETQSETRR